ncbi:hypothetical protein J132_00909 [Termitomyces sp. J132]|nr:hypothetical protein C0989_011198 [Termitomyces sp. Mn162]KAH0579043.1 hypothetical protein H2248_003203 [Termitomyces sp. 'cryptogamus']KNZ75896.1 hypothetical protein J132_00909 [Termitomyces sp. J132]
MSAPLTTSGLPISQLESLRFKSSQIIDSIQSLQRTIEAGHMAAMPAWPDILTKYNILLSQTHSFSMGLASTPSGGAASQNSRSGSSSSPLERVVLHPSTPLTDAQLDGEVIPLLRNQQTTDVLRVENETVRRLAEHMVTKGSIGVLAPQPSSNLKSAPFGMSKKPVEYPDVIAECDEIREAHDRRVERAVRAVTMLRERFDWRARVEVEVEEPEELEWDPRVHPHVVEDQMDEDENEGDEAKEAGDGDVGMDDDQSGEEEEVQALVNSTMDAQSPPPSTIPTDTNAVP